MDGGHFRAGQRASVFRAATTLSVTVKRNYGGMVSTVTPHDSVFSAVNGFGVCEGVVNGKPATNVSRRPTRTSRSFVGGSRQPRPTGTFPAVIGTTSLDENALVHLAVTIMCAENRASTTTDHPKTSEQGVSML